MAEMRRGEHWMPGICSRKSQRLDTDSAESRLACAARRINDAFWPLEPKLDSGHIGCRGTESRGAAIKAREAKSKMRSFLVAVTALALFATGAAQAKVAITVDKDNQQMTVAVDGVERYHWPVSSGIPSYEIGRAHV